MGNRIHSSLRATYLLGLGAIALLAMPIACDTTETTTTGSSASSSGASESSSTTSSSGQGGTAGSGQGGMAGSGQGGMAGSGQGGMAGSGQGGMAGSGQGGMAGSGQGGMAGSGQGGMAGSGQGGAGGQGGSGAVEDCLNGVDDDADGLMDCMDADCNAGFACVADVPAGWMGFVALFQGMPGQEPACPAAFPSVSPYVGNDMPSGTFTCGACACGAPTGQVCDLPDLLQVMNAPCGQNATAVAPLPVPAAWAGTCYGPSGWPAGQTCNGSPCNSSVQAPKAVVTGGSCAPSGGAPSLMPVTWSVVGKACGDAPKGGGCDGGAICQPKAAAPFEPGLCIYKDGDNACPAGPYTQKHVYYEGVNDTRACAPCSCGNPQGSTCDATISVYTDQGNNQCNTVATTFQAGGCGNLSGNPAVKGRKATITPPSGGSCMPGVAVPSGGITPTNATTFCCAP